MGLHCLCPCQFASEAQTNPTCHETHVDKSSSHGHIQRQRRSAHCAHCGNSPSLNSVCVYMYSSPSFKSRLLGIRYSPAFFSGRSSSRQLTVRRCRNSSPPSASSCSRNRFSTVLIESSRISGFSAVPSLPDTSPKPCQQMEYAGPLARLRVHCQLPFVASKEVTSRPIAEVNMIPPPFTKQIPVFSKWSMGLPSDCAKMNTIKRFGDTITN